MSHHNTAWDLGVNFVAPIYNAGALNAQVDIAKTNQRIALDMYGQTALRAFTEVETTLANEQLLVDQQTHAQAALASDTEALRLRKVRFNIGSVDTLSVLQLQERQLRALRTHQHPERTPLQPHLTAARVGGNLPSFPTP